MTEIGAQIPDDQTGNVDTIRLEPRREVVGIWGAREGERGSGEREAAGEREEERKKGGKKERRRERRKESKEERK